MRATYEVTEWKNRAHAAGVGLSDVIAEFLSYGFCRDPDFAAAVIHELETLIGILRREGYDEGVLDEGRQRLDLLAWSVKRVGCLPDDPA